MCQPKTLPNLSKFYSQHFNWNAYDISLRKGNEIIAHICLVHTSKAWTSLPHFSYGGYDVSDEDVKNLPDIKKIISYIISNNISAGSHNLEIDKILKTKSVDDIKYFIRSVNYHREFLKSNKICSVIYLPADINNLWLGLNSNLRRKINKAKLNGLTTKNGGLSLLNDYYKVYLTNIKSLKSLAYPKSFFRDLLKYAPADSVKLFVVYIDNEAIGSSLLLSNNGFHENAYFATNYKFRNNYVSDFLHWSMLDFIYKSKNNVIPRVYSLGRSSLNSTVHNYKSHWPVTDLPLYIQANINNPNQSKFLKKALTLFPHSFRMLIGKFAIKHIY